MHAKARTQVPPLGAALVTLGVWIVLTIVGGPIIAGERRNPGLVVTQGIAGELVLAPLAMLGIILILRWQRTVGLQHPALPLQWNHWGLEPPPPPRRWQILWLPGQLILLVVAASTLLGLPPIATVISLLINTLLLAASEELMFRGVLLHGFLSRFAFWPALISCTTVFGAVQALNGFATGDVHAAVAQVVPAMLSGFWLLAVRIRAQVLYPAILIHGLWDFSIILITTVTTGQASPDGRIALPDIFHRQLLEGFVLALIPFLYGLWLLRSVGEEDKTIMTMPAVQSAHSS